jgi:chemotaxis receptor (MCP) glutamine deamidase CheD
MLPNYPATGPATLSIAAGRRYVDFTIRDLARQFDTLGAHRGEIEVKLFGGGDVLLVSELNMRPTVEDEGFAVVASSLGGTSGIHIEFNTETGEVLLRRLI